MPRLGPRDVFKTAKLPRIGREGWLKVITQLTKLHSVEEVLAASEDQHEGQFVDDMLRELEVSFQYFEEELKRIPAKGPVVLICNHPLAGIDAILLIKLVAQVRPDLQIIGSDLWQDLRPIAHHWSLEGKYSAGPNLKECLDEGKAVAVFPSKGVSKNYRISKLQLEDGEWDQNIIRQIQEAEVAVNPVFFKANQTFINYLVQRLGPVFQDLNIPSEIRSYKSRPVTIRIGRTIYPKELSLYPQVHQLTSLLRQRVYLLSNALAPEFRLFGTKRPAEAKAIADPIDPLEIQKEIDYLRNRNQALVAEKRHYQVFLSKAAPIPNIIRELGRLRELTFRAIGEGSNLALDLDTFDYHYDHLILWDQEKNELAGAYRLAVGSEVYPKYGFNGFYVSTLFKFKRKIRPMLGRSLEMGRAFVVPEHQQKPLPLFVMWNGIKEVMRRHEELEFIVGCASISNNFSKFSRNLMVGFLLKNFGDASLAQEIRPKKPYRLKLKSGARDMVLNSSPEDLVQFDRKIDELEPGELRFPPLIKKYLQQKALIVCFNIDPLFNNSLDGFMYIHRDNIEL